MQLMLPHVTSGFDGNVVTLLDIPASIEDAQETTLRIRAETPAREPYPSTEPKGLKLQKAIEAIDPTQLQYDRSKSAELERALTALTKHLKPFCLPWCFARVGRAAVLEMPVAYVHDQRNDEGVQSNVPIILSPIANRFSSLGELQDKVVMNPSSVRALLETTTGRYLVPPRATFVWSSISRGLEFFEKVAARSSFPLIVMDPPWSNRSIKRSRKYKTVEHQQHDPFEEAVRIVGTHLSPRGLAAVWVTNKAAVRIQVMEAMRGLGLELRAEITYLKVTRAGLPVTAIGGTWRKPYEILLVFSSSPTSVESQVIVAVPDIHSRKPALKRIFEPHLAVDYTALELFARSMTAGWWAWGDEVLKFQDTREWNIME